MGQQQLLLVILVTIIVGVATVVAINVFGTSAKNANLDAVRQDVLTIGSQAQGWYMKPTMMNGGGGSFTGLNFTTLGFGYSKAIDSPTAPLDVSNANGEYKLDASAGDSLKITATPVQAKDSTITAWVKAGNIRFQ